MPSDIPKTHISIPSPTKTIHPASPPADEQKATDAVSPSTNHAVETQLSPPTAATPYASLDDAQPLRRDRFPNQSPNGSSLPGTIQNVRHMLRSYGVTVRYNVIKKKTHIATPGGRGTTDNADNVAMAHIYNLAVLNGIPTSQVSSCVEVIADNATYNPVAEWINSKSWDGQDRIRSVCDTLIVREGFPVELRNLLVERWLLSAVAAALKDHGFRSRGVLTLQGPQSIGKTSWVLSLVPDPLLRDMLVKGDHHLDGNNKDSILTAVSHWIVEIGELDSSFKKDIARLKGFLTSGQDKLRRPYARGDSEYTRRTVFCATVNESNFLVDATGNTRWWTIPVTAIDTKHGIDMQQVFAQLAVTFKQGDACWWLSESEEKLLELHNNDHRNVSAIREALMEILDLDSKDNPHLQPMTASQVLREAGFEKPTTPQCREAGGILRELLGEPKRIRGETRWRIPLKSGQKHASHKRTNLDDDDDGY